VSEAFADPFLGEDGDNARFFGAGRPGHLVFDIAAYVAARLAAAGVTRIDMLDEDTYSQPERFFSYRRSCHLGEPGYGRQISVIGMG
jgi:copper oxidase (laccase) domain-containing protein